MMKHQRLHALFLNIEDATDAINMLIRKGYDTKHISMMTDNQDGHFARYVNTASDVHVDSNSAFSFGLVSGLLIGLSAVSVPGLGVVLATGPIVAALTGATVGAVAGGATGGLIGSFIEWGITEEDMRRYKQVLAGGGALVITDVLNSKWTREKLDAAFKAFHAVDVKHYTLL